jgi:hypothetical protein
MQIGLFSAIKGVTIASTVDCIVSTGFNTPGKGPLSGRDRAAGTPAGLALLSTGR